METPVKEALLRRLEQGESVLDMLQDRALVIRKELVGSGIVLLDPRSGDGIEKYNAHGSSLCFVRADSGGKEDEVWSLSAAISCSIYVDRQAPIQRTLAGHSIVVKALELFESIIEDAASGSVED